MLFLPSKLFSDPKFCFFNPTLYHSDPSEYTFSAIGSNWPDLNEDAEDDEFATERAPSRARQTLSRINPVRHAKNLIRWVL